MRYIVASNGSYGDVLPFAAIAKGLAARGHESVFVSNDRYRDAAPGARFVAADTADALEAALAQCRVTQPKRALPILMRDLVARPARRFYEAISAAIDPGGTVLVGFPLVVGAKLASQVHGVRLIHGHLSPVSLRSTLEPPRFGPSAWPAHCPPFVLRALYRLADHVFDRQLRRPLGELQAELGLPVTRRSWAWANECDGALALFPEWFAASARDWPEHLEQTTFPLACGPRPESPAGEEPPQVIATAGSPARGTRRFFEAVASACARRGVTCVLVSRYPDEVPDPLEGRVSWVRHAPFSAWMPKAELVIHHGGAGTSAEALRAGTPQLVVPWGVDQFEHAARLVELGVAKTVPFRQATTNRLVRGIASILDDPSIRARCQAIAGRFAADPLEPTCAAIESWSRSPNGD